jgi:protein-tyrosine phosphatase
LRRCRSRQTCGVLTLRGVIDLHCHVLPGIDDGPPTLQAALALAEGAAADGVRAIVATPHVSWRYPNDAATIARARGELVAALGERGLALDVLAGAELAMSRIADIEPDELRRLTLGGGGWLLLEPPFVPSAYGLDAIVFDLQRQGFRIVLAHPERCAAFRRDPGLLASLVEAGALTSITAGSLVGRFGAEVRRFAHALVRDSLAHNVASDAHDTTRRPPALAAELQRAGLAPLGDWLTRLVPEAILAGGAIPPRPAVDLSRPARLRLPWRRRGS